MGLLILEKLPAEKIGSPSKGMAEGGRGGNSAIPLQKIEASPAALLFKARHHRKILFSLREKEIRRAKNEKSKEYFSVVWRAERAGGGVASLVPFKVGSSKVQNIPQNNTFAFFRGGCLRAFPPPALWCFARGPSTKTASLLDKA